jgi:hypothetical protein
MDTLPIRQKKGSFVPKVHIAASGRLDTFWTHKSPELQIVRQGLERAIREVVEKYKMSSGGST